MNVLLDTCALLALSRGELPGAATRALQAAQEAWVSSISPWEVAIKSAGGKLRIKEPPFLWFLGLCERHTLREVPIEARIVCAAAVLPPIHRDPFDRVLVALAQANALTVLTSDQSIPRYPGVKTLW